MAYRKIEPPVTERTELKYISPLPKRGLITPEVTAKKQIEQIIEETFETAMAKSARQMKFGKKYKVRAVLHREVNRDLNGEVTVTVQLWEKVDGK